MLETILADCREEKENILQVFILTHNTYFYKEVSFLGRGSYGNIARYWILRKHNNLTSISDYPNNPILTTYELLWQEIREAHTEHSVSVYNSMRRVLEHYFDVIGGIKYEKCIDCMEGTDKILCKSLLSLINDGSHTVFEDLFIPTNIDSNLTQYLDVFKKIFKVSGQIGHYNMMMKVNDY